MNPYDEDWLHWEQTRSIENSALAKYLGEQPKPEIFRCPSDDITFRPRVDRRGPYNYSYSMNMRFSSYRTRLKFSQVRDPSGKVMLVEEQNQTLDDGNWHPNFPSKPNYLSTRHDRNGRIVPAGKPGYDPLGRGNVAFAAATASTSSNRAPTAPSPTTRLNEPPPTAT